MRPRRTLVLGWIVTAVLAGGAAQRPATGQAAPLPALSDLEGVPRSLKDLMGARGLVLVFWAGWSDRSVDEIKRFDADAKEITTHGVGLVAVNVEHQDATNAALGPVREKVASLGVSIPVLVDAGLELFKAYGVISVPTTALVDAEGRLVLMEAGYSTTQRERLLDEIHKLAGIADTRVLPAGPQAAPAAIRRLNLGRSQFAGGRVAGAKASFLAAIDADPTFADPLVELAALALDEGDLAQAESLLGKAVALDAANRLAARERLRLQFLRGSLDPAAVCEQLRTLAGKDAVAAAYCGAVEAGTDTTQAAGVMTKARREGRRTPQP